MNLALPALIILLSILPGVVFERAYYAGRFARRVAGLTAGSEVVLYVLLAIPIDLFAVEACKWFGIIVDWPTIWRLVFGSLPDPGAVESLSTAAQADIKTTAIAYSITIVLSYAVGASLRRAVWASFLDTKFHVLRMKSEWFYQLLGRGRPIKPSLAIADVMTMLPGEASGSRLYRGVVSHFQPSESGGLQLLTLEIAKRGKGRGTAFEWIEIPGNEIVILGSCIHSINLEYIKIDGDPVETPWRGFWRRFRLEEP